MSVDVTMTDAAVDEGLGYKLSRTVPTFDTSAVKCLSYQTSSNTILLGSEGGIVTSYNCNNATSNFTNVCHPYPITSLVDKKNSEKDGFIVGSREGYIRVFNTIGNDDGTNKNELDYVYTAHDKSISSLNMLNNNEYLVSSSWDGTAKVWKNKNEIFSLDGHENATCSIVLPNNNSNIVTGSAGRHENNQIVDYKLRLWDSKSGKLIKEIPNNHKSSIRCLACTDTVFASCSNDGTVQFFDNNSQAQLETIHIPSGDSTLLLSVSFIQNGKYIGTCSEDGHVYIYDITSKEYQILPHPGCVWCIMSLPNGDFITGCQDGKARIFTKLNDRIASASEIADFDNEVQSFHTKTGLSQDEVNKLPIWETEQYNIKGKKEGHVQLFKKQDSSKAIAAQWSGTSQSWIEVGEVTATSDDSQSKGGTIDGVTFDYVFPIEVDTTSGTVQTLQIGHNIGDNPFVTAQMFIDKYELNQNYLSQIADYIQKRISDENVVQLGTSTTTTTAQQNTTNMNAATSTSSSKSSFTYLPIKTYFNYDTGIDNLSKVISKILQFQDAKYNAANKIITREQLSALQATLQNTSRYHSSKININVDILLSYLQSWDIKDIFPIIDLLRLIILHPDAITNANQSVWNQIIITLLEKMNHIHNNIENYAQDKLLCGIVLLSLRFMCNILKTNNNNIFTSSLLSTMLKSTKSFLFIQSNNAKNIRLAIVTLLCNIVNYLQLNNSIANDNDAIIVALLEICKEIIICDKKFEKDAMIRVCMMLGTLGIKHKSICLNVGIKEWMSDILVDENDVVFLGVVKELHILFA